MFMPPLHDSESVYMFKQLYWIMAMKTDALKSLYTEVS